MNKTAKIITLLIVLIADIVGIVYSLHSWWIILFLWFGISTIRQIIITLRPKTNGIK